jgi:hypothetical protein
MAVRPENAERGLYRCDSCGLFFNFNQVHEHKESHELYPTKRMVVLYRYVCYRCEAAEKNFGIKEQEEK